MTASEPRPQSGTLIVGRHYIAPISTTTPITIPSVPPRMMSKPTKSTKKTKKPPPQTHATYTNTQPTATATPEEIMRDYERRLHAARENFHTERQQFQHRSRVRRELLEQALTQLEAADEIERQAAEVHQRYQEWQDSQIAEDLLHTETRLEQFDVTTSQPVSA